MVMVNGKLVTFCTVKINQIERDYVLRYLCDGYMNVLTFENKGTHLPLTLHASLLDSRCRKGVKHTVK